MVSVMLYPCIFCIALSMDLLDLCIVCLTVFVNYLVKQFAIFLGMVVILLLTVGGSAMLDRPCMLPNRVCVVPVITVCIQMLIP